MATGKNHSGKRYVNDTLPVPGIRTKEKLLLLSPLLLLLLLLLLGLEFVISISACYILPSKFVDLTPSAVGAHAAFDSSLLPSLVITII